MDTRNDRKHKPTGSDTGLVSQKASWDWRRRGGPSANLGSLSGMAQNSPEKSATSANQTGVRGPRKKYASGNMGDGEQSRQGNCKRGIAVKDKCMRGKRECRWGKS